jgi:hypothetical protein
MNKLSFEIPKNAVNAIFWKKISDDMFEEICSLTPHVKDQSRASIPERVYCIENNIFEIPKCPECGKNVNYLRSKRYAEFCCQKCSTHSEKILSKMKNSHKSRTGYDNPAQNPVLREEMKIRRIEKNGVDAFKHTLETKIKISNSRALHYQSIINEEGTDYSGIVYILHFPHLNAVKIGLSSNFKKRGKILFKDFGNFEVIQLIETDTCFRLESELHEKFSEYRICLEEGCGRTEFFKEEILEKLSNFLV